MKHLIAVGACYLDTILTVPHFPSEDSKLRATGVKVRRGGNCPNTLEVLQQLLSGIDGSRYDDNGNGQRTEAAAEQVTLHLLSCLPDANSPARAKIVSSFGADTTVDFSMCLHRGGHDEAASCYIIRSAETGSRTIVNFNDLPELVVDEFIAKAGLVAGQDCWWHFEGRIPETTLKCVQHLRRSQPGCKISVEVERPGREGLTDLAAQADVVFYSRNWAESRGYTSAEACLRGESSPRASSIFCTWGERGACGLTVQGQDFAQHCPTIRSDFRVVE
ncbi:putative PfkB family kinase [Thozetella sp. PMI_491]|nr:putative PfkB family kinase [Thozetella sp. PMI_491]